MGYYLFKYVLFFLPLAMIVYQITPKRYRFLTLLSVDYVFFFLISKGLIVYLIASTLVCFCTGLLLERIDSVEFESKKLKTKKKKKILTLTILLFLGILFVLKYFNFFAQGVVSVVGLFDNNITYSKINFLIPIGISYYTLQIISYLTDICRGTQKVEHNIFKIALYLSFFPQIMEGPISRFSEVAEDLYAGEELQYSNIKRGYQRILWGLFKKYMIADRVAAVVGVVFDDYSSYDGSIILVGVLLYTCQLYMEFSGCIDMAIGSGEIFGVHMPENFKQPFFATDASDFWHRWHITLGTWFKDYIFYPVTMSKMVKNIGKFLKKKFGRYTANTVTCMMALFCVWISNGLWHGPKTTYIFYGLYYFVIITLEIIVDKPWGNMCGKIKVDRLGKGYKVFQFVKLFIIVNIGEMFFRADTVGAGFSMFRKIITNFHISALISQFMNIGMDLCDWIIALFGLIIVICVGVVREKGVDIREKISQMPLPCRWVVWYAMLTIIVIFGAYGPEYSEVAMIYAGY